MGCRRTAGQPELERISLAPDGTPRIGPRLGGRGAWICAGERDCLERALRRRALTRALRAPLTDHAVAELRARWDELHPGDHSAVRAGPGAARD